MIVSPGWTVSPSFRHGGWLRREDCSIDDFRVSMEAVTTDIADYPHAAAVERGVLLYDRALASKVQGPKTWREVQAEIACALMDGPGIAVFQGAFDAAVIDRATDAFNQMLGAPRAAGRQSGDHFAKPDADDRIWGALDKLAVTYPDVFFDYYANDIVALASRAWLGPNYQVTSALNIVNHGGQGADRAS
jgi:hypothetical protein